MKAFDLDLYNQLVKEGKTPKLFTRSGQSVRLVCVDKRGRFPLVGLIDNGDTDRGVDFTKKGWFEDTPGSDLDLFFADVEPTYRPYKDKDECFCDMHRHRHLVRHRDGDYHLVVTITDGIVWLGNASVGIETKRLLEEFTFVDGTPCGVKEE